MYANHLYDTSSELLIQRFGGGIKLIRPDAITPGQRGLYSVASILALPFSVYFKNAESRSVNLNVNEIAADNMGASSIKDFIGKTSCAFATKDTVEPILQHDQDVINEKNMLIRNVNYRRQKDNVGIQTITVKFPWYGLNNEVIGVFGCSIRLEEKRVCSLSQALLLLVQTGLLSNPDITVMQP